MNISWNRKVYSLIGLILFFNFFFFRPFGAVAGALQLVGIFIFLLSAFYSQKKLKPRLLLIGASAVIIFSIAGFFVTRGYWFVSLVLHAIAFITLLVLIYSFHSEHPYVRSLVELLLLPLRVAIHYISHVFKTIRIVFNYIFSGKPVEHDQKIVTEKSRVRPIIIGLIVSIPIAAILISLLSGADPIYAQFIKQILSEQFLKEVPGRIILSLFFFCVFLPLLFFSDFKVFTSPIAYLRRYNVIQEISIVMGIVGVILASFLIIQWPYIFANVPFETDLSKLGVATYSEYVRKGFIELLQVAFIVYALLWSGVIALRSEAQLNKRTLHILFGVIALLFLIFIVSVFRRIWLYQEYHGWTLIRIYGGVFLLWLTGITVTLAIRPFVRKNWTIVESIWTVGLVLAVGFFNAEHFIVTNHPPTVNKRVDYVYLSRMSEDGKVGWKQAVDFAERTLTGVTTTHLNDPFRDIPYTDIPKDARRDIAYSGMVIENMLENYDRLVKDYGTKEDLQKYYSTVLAYEAGAREQAFNKVDPERQANFTHLKNEITIIERLRNEINQQNPEAGYFKAAAKQVEVYNYSDYGRFTSFTSTFEGQILSFYSFYTTEPTYRGVSHNLPLTGWNKITAWNKAEAEAFKLLKNEIGIDRLIKLQDEYFHAFEKISMQVETERDYERDISTDSPLL